MTAAPLLESEAFECPNCNGMGETRGPEMGMPYYLCRYCDGHGAVSEAAALDWGTSDSWWDV